jgi:hypothetical protein
VADDPCDDSGRDEASEAVLAAPIAKDSETEIEGCRRALT